jgi:hypothetical protein
MKNVTLSADDSLIEQARALARLRGTTLNEEFRKWLASYSSEDVGGLKLAQTRAMLDELTAPIPEKAFLPLDYRFAPASRPGSLREPGGGLDDGLDNEREARMVRRLDGKAA